MEFFTSPWYMAAGGALVSAPILIHLIHRMRYKRVRWAAMEFLLKSQKKNRRRLIIEQLILLLLRILLVLLAAFLVARFLYAGAGARGGSHVLVIDDTMSMADRGKAGAVEKGSFAIAVEQTKKVFEQAAKAPSAQSMTVYLLSDIERTAKAHQAADPDSKKRPAPLVFWTGTLTDKSAQAIEQKFIDGGMKPTLLHARPLLGLQLGHVALVNLSGEQAQGTKVLHLVSDFRDSDWTGGDDAEKIADEVKSLAKDGINVNLVDAATPYRTAASKVALASDNVAIVDLKANTRVAIEEADVQLTAFVTNFGQGEALNKQLKVYVNGQEALNADQVIDKILAGKTEEVKFNLRFPKRPIKGGEINEKDGPAERERKRRLDRGYFNVRVALTPREETGLHVDNVRDLVLEVRKKIPSLVIDGNKPENRTEAGDMNHLKAFSGASGIYDLEERPLKDLETADLDLYPSIILLNVPEIPPAVILRLKQYVENGGSLCHFLGEDIKADHYNTELFKAGLFPVQISGQPYDPLATAFGDPELRKNERERLRQTDPTPKILFPNRTHPLVATIAPFQRVFRYLSINVYWKAQPRSQWDPEPHKAETLIVLPNSRPVDEFRQRALDLASQAVSKTGALAAKDDKFKPFIGAINNAQIRIRDNVAKGELYQMSEAFDAMLKDAGEKDNPDKPNMQELWQQAEMKALRDEIKEFREAVLYGDPLVVSKAVGKGRVVAMLTPAGTSLRRGVAGEESVQWNNWGTGEKLVSGFYPLFLKDLQRYLVSEGQAPNRLLGEEINFNVDAKRYEPGVSWTFTPQPDLSAENAKIEPEKEKEKAVMTKNGGRLEFSLKDAATHRPGVYEISLVHIGGEGAAEDRTEKRSYAYNVDAASESNLKRASRDRLVPDGLPKDPKDPSKSMVRLYTPEDPMEGLDQKTPDASEWPWLYLFILIILVVEQALAVHLSHHTRGEQGESAPAVPATPAAA